MQVAAEEGGKVNTSKFETWQEAFREQGRQEGLKTGVQEGRQQALEQSSQALRSVLKRLLTRRSAPLPTRAGATIADASFEQLSEWINRAMEGESAEALFAAPLRQVPGSPDPAHPSSLSDLGSSAAKIPGAVHISPLSRSIARY